MNSTSGRRLEKLAAFLREGADDSGLPGAFSMTDFFGTLTKPVYGLGQPHGYVDTDSTWNVEISRKSYSELTVACAIGWTPFVLGIAKRAGESFEKYAFRVFGVKARTRYFLFSAYWDELDNTPVGAAARIDRFLAAGGKTPHGLPWWYGDNRSFIDCKPALLPGAPLLAAREYDRFYDVCDRKYRDWKTELPQALRQEVLSAVAA